MSWIPVGTKSYHIFRAGGEKGLRITFSENECGVELAPWTEYKPISELAKDLAISDVCQQIRERNTIDECSKQEWDEARMNIIGRNGNNGEHYEKRSKYHREIKPGVWVDVYDVLNAFGVKCHALAHAIKKLLMPGDRGHKGYNQDCEEAIQSIRRSIDENV